MNNFIYIDFITISETEIKIELNTEKDVAIRIILNKDRVFHPNEHFKRIEVKEDKYESVFKLPKSVGKLYFEIKISGQWVLCKKVIYGPFCPIGIETRYGFYCDDSIIIQTEHNSIKVQNVTRRLLFMKSLLFWFELIVTSNISRKALFVRTVSKLVKNLFRKPIYIVHDRYEQAGDNGEAFWIWLRNERKHEVNSFFVLDKKCEKYNELSKKGHVIQKDSLIYRILLMASTCLIDSAGYADLQNYANYYRDITAKITYVFLQHGVIYDNIAVFMTRYTRRFDYVVTSSCFEKNHICDTQGYYYSEKQVLLTGLPRFDFLHKDRKKMIVVMPTWRAYLNELTAKEFSFSRYYQFWKSLMQSEELVQLLEKNQYKVKFKMHPAAAKFINVLEDDGIELIDTTIDYNTIYAESSLIITDYSSAVSDFAYMKSPIIYIQFDKDEFFSGKHTHTRGYFDFEKDGFGPVVYNLKEAIQEIKKCIEGDCILEDKYKKRIEKFYENIDKLNCKRLYDIISKEKN